MDKSRLVTILSTRLPQELANDIVDNFLILRKDVATRTFGRSAPGKFVETYVQIVQHLETGHYDVKPNVDYYLKNIESRSIPIDDGLKICGARIARAMYTLRNKRAIAHKGDVDPNRYDLQFLHSGAQWILSELIRLTTGVTMDEAGKLVLQVQAPIENLVEDFGDKRLVLGNYSARTEILILLHSLYPDIVEVAMVKASLDRHNPKNVGKCLRVLWKEKLVEPGNASSYQLTETGYREASRVISRLLTKNKLDQ